jgi:hypothetical protein
VGESFVGEIFVENSFDFRDVCSLIDGFESFHSLTFPTNSQISIIPQAVPVRHRHRASSFVQPLEEATHAFLYRMEFVVESSRSLRG